MKTRIEIESDDEDLPDDEFADQYGSILQPNIRIDLLMLHQSNEDPEAYMQKFFGDIRDAALIHYYNRYRDTAH